MKSLRPQRAKKFAARFCENGFNASKAVRELGITNNPKSAWVIGHRLLSNVVTIKAIEDHLMTSKMSADEVLERLTDIARQQADFKGSDVVKANELLGKGHKLFTDRVETTSSESSDIASILLGKIKSSAQKSGISEHDSACKLFDSLQEWGSEHADPANFGPYAEIVANHAKAQQNAGNEQVIEGGDQ